VHTHHFPLALICAALVHSPSWANDEDVLTVGPNGRSSIGFTTSYKTASYNTTSYDIYGPFSSLSSGRVENSATSVTLTGIYAINNRLSLVGSIPWLFNNQYSSTFLGTTSTFRIPNQLEYSVGASALLWGNVEKTGFRLSGYVGTSHATPNRGTTYTASVTPQYWISNSLGFSANLGVLKPPEGLYKTGATSQLTIIWRATSNLVFTPSISASYFPANYGFPTFQSRHLGTGATYTFDRNWAIYTTASVGTRPAQTTSFGTTSDNFRDKSISIGVRHSF
jgi:hypothetical protein